jgi:hypothetical protein
MAAVAGHEPHAYSHAAPLAVRVRLSHYQSVKYARGTTWRIMTFDPHISEGRDPLFEETKTRSTGR